MRRASKVDENQRAIVMALRAIGYSVEITSMVGNGFVDIVVGSRGVNCCFEIKRKLERGKVSPSNIKLTEEQTKWHRNWKGQRATISTWEEAVRIINLEVSLRYRSAGFAHQP